MWKFTREREFWLVAAFFLAFTLPILLLKDNWLTFDEINFHVPEIMRIRQSWPLMDVRKDSFSAIAPGYHWFLAGLSLLTGDQVRTLRLINCLVSALIPLSLYVGARQFLSARWSLLSTLPLVTSSYLIKSSAVVSTDNAALLLVLWTLMAILRPTRAAARAVTVGLLAAAATFVRQQSVWLAVPATIRAAWPPTCAAPPPGRPATGLVGRLFSPANLLFFAGAALPPLIVLGYLYMRWGGLVPGGWYQSTMVGVSACPGAFALALFAFFGVCYLAIFPLRRWREWASEPAVRLAALFGLVIALISPNTWNAHTGRWGGYFWDIVAHVPAVAERSIFFLALAPIGAMVIAVLWLEMRRAGYAGQANLWLAAMVTWAAAGCANRYVYQRYFEPTSLIFIILAITRIPRPAFNPPRRAAAIALVCLTVLQVFITMATAYRVVWYLVFGWT